MAAALECWSGRPSTEEDMVEQVLMKSNDRSEAFLPSAGSASRLTGAGGVAPKRWKRIGRNFAGAITALRDHIAAARASATGKDKLDFGLCGFRDDDDDDGEKPLEEEEEVSNASSSGHRNPLPETSLVVSIDESQTVHSGGGDEMGMWLLSSNQIEIVNRVGSKSFEGLLHKGRKVWVKRLRRSGGGTPYEVEVKRDLLELMRSGHRSVLHLHGLWLEETQGLCLVSSFMEGGSLHELLRRGKPMPAKQIFTVALDVADGLMFFHDHGVAYRDLNTRRILLDEHGNACLADMGAVTLRRRHAAEVTEYETAGFRWLAPEMLAGDPETVSETWMSNVYSLGMVIWEMVTGEAAYGSYSPVQAAVGIAACGLRPEIPKECPLVLKSLMGRCWSSNPCRRPKLSEVVALLSKHARRLGEYGGGHSP